MAGGEVLLRKEEACLGDVWQGRRMLAEDRGVEKGTPSPATDFTPYWLSMVYSGRLRGKAFHQVQQKACQEDGGAKSIISHHHPHQVGRKKLRKRGVLCER